ncbi:MAG TPA: peptidoglycan-associated lipoprotein Pal [Vicinamibacterales bacterium]|jgi:peptidoglycan-associated lipoprotein|nr:peptidoglycan-associated lipoprotein Pal [Vicinamibacterales bacterium]
MRERRVMMCALVLAAVFAGGCGKKKPPVARPVPPPPTETSPTGERPPAPPEPVRENPIVPAEPTISDDPLASGDLESINKNSPFQPVFYALDSSDVDAKGQQSLNADAEILKKYSTWTITIEGHCDERGTAEYNLALGERRALAAKTYLVSLGISADRLRTVSYGKEFPFDPGHDESAWSKNRRAHFVVTSK